MTTIDLSTSAVEQPGDVELVDAVAGAHPFGALEVERARERREPFEHPLLGLGEQLVRPLHEIAQRAVARIGRAAGCRRARGTARAGVRPVAPGSSSASAPPRARARAARRRAGCRSRRRLRRSSRRARSRDERRAPGRRTAAPRGSRPAFPASRRGSAGTGSGGTDHTTSAGMPSGSRLVASTCTFGHQRRMSSTSSLVGVEHVLAVVEHEQQVLRAEQLDDRVGQRRLGRCCTSSASPTAAGTADSSRTGASSTSRTPSANCSPRAWSRAGAPGASCRHRPGRTSVRIRLDSKSRVASSRSRSRPTRGVLSAGHRAPRAAARTDPASRVRAMRRAEPTRARRVPRGSRSRDRGSPPTARARTRRAAGAPNSWAARSASACRPDR